MRRSWLPLLRFIMVRCLTQTVMIVMVCHMQCDEQLMLHCRQSWHFKEQRQQRRRTPADRAAFPLEVSSREPLERISRLTSLGQQRPMPTPAKPQQQMASQQLLSMAG